MLLHGGSRHVYGSLRSLVGMNFSSQPQCFRCPFGFLGRFINMVHNVTAVPGPFFPASIASRTFVMASRPFSFTRVLPLADQVHGFFQLRIKPGLLRVTFNAADFLFLFRVPYQESRCPQNFPDPSFIQCLCKPFRKKVSFNRNDFCRQGFSLRTD